MKIHLQRLRGYPRCSRLSAQARSCCRFSPSSDEAGIEDGCDFSQPGNDLNPEMPAPLLQQLPGLPQMQPSLRSGEVLLQVLHEAGIEDEFAISPSRERLTRDSACCNCRGYPRRSRLRSGEALLQVLRRPRTKQESDEFGDFSQPGNLESRDASESVTKETATTSNSGESAFAEASGGK